MVENGRIAQVAANIDKPADKVIDATGLHLLPGMIDDQVHFREPGLMHKGDIESESRAAVMGGITSYMEMPNVNPATTVVERLDEKKSVLQLGLMQIMLSILVRLTIMLRS